MDVSRRFFIGATMSSIIALATRRIVGVASPLKRMDLPPAFKREIIQGRIGLYSAPKVPDISELMIPRMLGHPVALKEWEDNLKPIANTLHEIPIGLAIMPQTVNFFTPSYRWTFSEGLDDPVHGLYLANHAGDIIYYCHIPDGPYLIENEGDQIVGGISGSVE